MENGKACCGCPHHKVVPLSIALIGLVILAGQMNWLSAGVVGIVWPVLLIVIGCTKMGGCKCC